MFTYKTIKNLIATSDPTFQELDRIYNQLPETQCLRRGKCCALLPEMTFIEALSAFQSLMRFKPEMQNRIFKRIVGYFFVNALEITSCPFLEGNTCLIYTKRFYGCRAYGLWSPRYYENRATGNRKAKASLQENWRKLGVNLPKTVMDFHQPYCLDVKSQNDAVINDATLEKLGDHIELLSEDFNELNHEFVQTFASDISFLSTSLVRGTSSAVRSKFTVVRDILSTGNREPLDRVLKDLPELNDID